MTYDEAMESIIARAPMAGMTAAAEATEARRPTVAGVKEERAYLLSRWIRRHGTDEELAALEMNR